MRKSRAYLTPLQAADLLGWQGKRRGKRMIRHMKAKEHQLGQPIMVRSGGPARPRYLLTEPMLRRYCAELFLTTPDDLATEARSYLLSLEGRVHALVDERVATSQAEAAQAWTRLKWLTDTLQQRVQQLERRVEELQRIPPRPRTF